MGHLSQFNIKAMRLAHKCDCLLETGTWQGAGVDFALASGFDEVYSCELHSEFAAKNKEKYKDVPRVTIFEGNSLDGLKFLLPSLANKTILFWLDAHLPACYGLQSNERDIVLPLKAELEYIRRVRPDAKDVILIDDIRIYIDGPFHYGNMSTRGLPISAEERNIDFIHGLFDRSHSLKVNYSDTGSLEIIPK